MIFILFLFNSLIFYIRTGIINLKKIYFYCSLLIEWSKHLGIFNQIDYLKIYSYILLKIPILIVILKV